MRGLPARIFRSVWVMVLVAFVVRTLCTLATQSFRFTGLWDLFEMANLARSLALGHGFSSPYPIETGPSALTPPVYPWLTSLAFRAFGVFSPAAGLTMVAFNSAVSALTCWSVYRIARRLFGETVALWSGWAWALWPYAIYYSIGWIWETSLSAFLLSLLVMLTLEMEDDARLRSWLVYGVVWGIAGLTNTALLSWLPFSGCWLVYRLHKAGKRFVVPVVVSAVVFWMTLTPWLVRNYMVFDQVIFIRDNFGNELRAGNNPQAEGWKTGGYDAFRNPQLAALVRKVGEPEVSTEQGRQAKEWIAENPGRFLVISVYRCYYYWAGLPRTWSGLPLPRSKQIKNLLYFASSLIAFAGLILAIKKRPRGIFPLASLVLFYPLTYYISNPEPRYRHAIEPELVILSVFLAVSILVPRMGRRDEEAAAPVLAAEHSAD